MPKPAKDVAFGLQAKGFECREGDHKFFHFLNDGKKTIIFTKISHGEKEIHDGLLATMARQVRLTKKQFNDLVDCPLDLDEYKELLRKSGAIENPHAKRPSTKGD
ncbi:MAG TPA: hypothetical protein PK400_01365 [Phycisphaerales bacterium]|nr:hypothetical protein [Phycisphaerales bacterium]HRQ75147.1 hypothetical protein [Phycisphaerales bacterium]